MSVIFQTLKKCRNAPYEGQQKDSFGGTPRFCMMRKGIIPAGALVLVILGAAAVYGTRFLGLYEGGADTESTGRLHAKASVWRAEYIPPPDQLPVAGFSNALAKESPQKSETPLHPDEKGVSLSQPGKHVAPLLQESTDGVGQLAKAMEKPEEPSLRGDLNMGAEKTENPGEDQGLQIRVQQCGEITSLVARVERLLAAGDFATSKELIDRLATLRGAEDSYVLKLQSYWHMRQGAFGDAAPLLAAVLEKDQEDLEAGINMAIVEIYANQIPAARKRLVHLKTIYDADTVIPQLLRQIEKQP